MAKEIPIRCAGNRLMPHTQLKAFQGNLKEMSEDEAAKFQTVILALGWIAPIFVWKGKDFILDGHARLKVLQNLLDVGYTIGPLPVVDVVANDRKQAGRILIALNARYHRMTEEGLYEFMHHTELAMEDMRPFSLPDIDLTHFEEAFFETEPGDGDGDEGGGSDDILSCTIVFDSKAQHSKWKKWLKSLEVKYPQIETEAERIVKGLR